MTSLGLTNVQIAGRLHVSIHAVKFHLAAIYRKLGVANRTEAAVLLPALGLDAGGPPGGRRLMDLPLFFRVLWRFRWLVALGVLVADRARLLLGLPDRHGERPRARVPAERAVGERRDRARHRAGLPARPRRVPAGRPAEELGGARGVHAASSRRRRGSSSSRTSTPSSSTGDAVRQLILEDGPLPGAVQAVPLVASNGSDAALPMVAVRGLSTTPEKAVGRRPARRAPRSRSTSRPSRAAAASRPSSASC